MSDLASAIVDVVSSTPKISKEYMCHGSLHFSSIVDKEEAGRRVQALLDETFASSKFVNVLNVIEDLPHDVSDDTPLRGHLPGEWPTVGDLRKLVKDADLIKED